jgi:hypothetical protein
LVIETGRTSRTGRRSGRGSTSAATPREVISKMDWHY